MKRIVAVCKKIFYLLAKRNYKAYMEHKSTDETNDD